MEINLIPDASVASAPSGFTAAVQAAAAIYDNDFPGNYTVNITYGWGTYDNVADSELTNAEISLGGVDADNYVSYATLKNWLGANATLSDQKTALASLPASDDSLPGDPDSFFVSTAQEKALGVFTGQAGAVDGSIGFGTDSFDWQGLALCEIGHALGWMTDYYVNAPTALDLLRFSSPGVRDWTGGQAEYFSTDGGVTGTANFATSFDYTLFTNLTNDPFCAPVDSSTLNLTSLDLEVLNDIGFGGGPQITAPTIAFSSASFSGSSFSLAVTASDKLGVTGVEIYDDGFDIGAATFDAATGDWDFSGSFTPGQSVTLEAVATDEVSLTASVYIYYETGGGNIVDFAGAGDAALLSGTDDNWDKLFGSSETIELASAQTSIIGGDDLVLVTGGSGNEVKLFSTGGAWDKVFGSDMVGYVVNSQVRFIGGDDSIRCSGTDDQLKLFSTGGESDKVFGFNLAVNLVSSQASFIDGGNTIRCSGSDDQIKLFATIGQWDKVFGTGLTASLINAQASFVEGGDTIRLLNGADDSVKLFATGTSADSVFGANSTIALIGASASVTGSDDSIHMFEDDAVTLNGSSEAFVFQPAIGQDVINGFGASDSMQFSASDFANWSALQAHLSTSGANTVITLDANDSVTLTNVTVASLSASQFKFT
jgi:hypothetical protein